MPVRHKDIFEDMPLRLNKQVNPFVRELTESSSNGELPILYGSKLKGMKGKWRSYFASLHPSNTKPKKLILEIGVHKGKVLEAMASNHEADAFIGLDITFKRVVLTARRSKESKLSNLVSVLGDARHIKDIFEPGELDGIVAFFPDPWEKKASQLKNRLFSESYCKELSEVLSANGTFWFKTDSVDYFQQVNHFAETAGLTKIASTEKVGLVSEEYESNFEQLFKQQKLPTFEQSWIKAGLLKK